MRLQRAEWATALLITLFAVTLHALRLVHAGPLWRDEAAAFNLATSPTLAEVVARHESFPPPFFFLVRGWTALFGGSDTSLRFFGLLTGLALAAVLWWSVRKTAGTVPLLALALVAVHPAFLLYGDSLRGYGLGTVAIVVAFGAFARLDGRGSIATAAVASLVAVQLLFFNAALLLALGLAVILGRRPRAILAVVGIGAATALSLLLWIEPVLATRSWSGLLEVPLGPREIFGEMARTAGMPWVWLPLLLLAFFPQDRKGFVLLALPGLLLAQWGFMEALAYPPRPWYFLAVLALLAVALDVRLSASVPWRVVRLWAALLAVLAIALPALTAARTRMTNVDLVAERIAAEARPEDLVVVTPWYMGISYLRYDRGPAPWMTAPDLPDHRIHRFDLLKGSKVDLGAIERTLRSGDRIWLAGRIETSPPELAAFLNGHAARRERSPIRWDGPVNGYERLDLFVFSGWRKFNTSVSSPDVIESRRCKVPTRSRRSWSSWTTVQRRSPSRSWTTPTCTRRTPA